MVRRIIRIVLSPREEWPRIAGESWHAAAAYAALLSLIPAAAAFVMRQSSPVPFPGNTVVATYAAFVAGIAFVAAAFFVMKRAAWPACVKVAAYGATPALVAGAALASPVLVMVTVVSMLHVFYLYYLGVQALLGVREADAAIFVAIALVAGSLAGTLGGAAAAAVGVL